MIPLSYAQRRLWFLNRLDGQSATYNAPVVVRLAGVPDAAALAAALTDLTARHEVLRTVLPVVGGEPCQRVLEPPSGLLTVVRCGADEADVLVGEFCGLPFDLLTDLPLRARLFVTGPDASVLVLLLHHVATDGGSLGPLLRDLAEAYAARLAGTAPARPPLDIQYADYALWQRDVLGDPADPDSEAAEQLAYWRAALDGLPDRLALPADRPHPAEPSGRGGLATARVDGAALAGLRALGRARRASLAMVLQAGLAAALAAVSGQRDVAIGTPVAGRGAEEALEDLVGFFVNSLVLRADVPPDLPFTDLVDRVRETALGAFAHQDLPFDLLVEHLNPERTLAWHPFFQVMLTLDATPQDGYDLGGVPGRISPVDLRAAKFDLTVFCTELPDGDGLEIWWQYAQDLFDETTARLLLTVFTRVLEAVATTPARPADTTDLLTAEELAGLAERRRRLTPPEKPGTSGKPEGAVALTPRQEILAGLFAEALGLPFVGGDDNFFRSGGHSLLGVRLVNRIRAVLDVEIGIRDLFLTPTVVGLDARIGESAGADRPPLVPVDRSGGVPLSFAQRRLWFVHELEGPGRAYNIPVLIRLTHPVDPTILAAALADVADRHEVLRSVFTVIDGEPHQRVHPTLRPHLQIISATKPNTGHHPRPNQHEPERGTNTPAEDAHGRSSNEAAVLDALAGHAFDVGAEPPLRAALVTTGSGDVLVLVLHHIAGDGWSVGRLLADLGEAYAARARGEAPAWAPLPVQYGDYAVWQRALLGGADDPDSPLARQLAYWKETLEGAPPLLEIPGHRPRPAAPAPRGELVPFELDAAAHRALARLAAASGATLFMVVQAAFAVVLERLGAGRDLPIGTVVAGRDDEALHDLVGFFVNTLVLRTDVSGDPTFAELLARVRAADLAAYAHQEVPFDLVVEHLNPVRSTSRHPLVQVMLTVQTSFQEETAGSPLAGTEIPVAGDTAKFDLTVAVRERRDPLGAPDGLSCVVESAADLFDPDFATLVSHLLTRTLLTAPTTPDLPISALNLTDPTPSPLATLDEGPASREAPDPRPVPVPRDATLPDLFADHVAAAPDATAVIAADGTLTYRELDAASAALAARLAAHGARRGQTVAVLLDRALPLATTVLAIARTGAAHAVLDPATDPLPLLLESRATLLVSDPTHPTPPTFPVLLLDTPNNPAPPTPNTPPDALGMPVTSHAPDASGMPGTSGMSGAPLALGTPDVSRMPFAPDESGTPSAPRGSGDAGDAVGVVLVGDVSGEGRAVLVSHRVVVGACCGGRGVVRLQWGPVSWGSFVAEFWGALAVGGTCVLASRARPSAEEVADLVVAHGVTALALPARLLERIAEVRPEALARLREVAVTGVPREDGPRARVRALLRDARVVHAPDLAGGPVGGAVRYVLDARLRPVPAGTPGELYVGGDGLAEGFPAAPGVSATRFVADPFRPDGGRMARTGALVRRAADGTLRHLGPVADPDRLDTGAVEEVLLLSPQVREAAVVIRDGGLVAYVVLAPGADATGLRERVGEVLAEHLVPDAVVALPALPLTEHGGLDRAALPAPERAAPAGRPPRGPVEELLAALFRDLLGGRPVGVDDNFFKIGGHSLLAVRLLNRVRASVPGELTLRDVFQAPTVATLAARLQAAAPQAPAPEAARPALRRRTRGGARLHDAAKH
ncbi:condensation domain-containing protein [Actinocorallia sp. API 0066]|uniref:condensation domain-containing protein n=1 Tax=Actinocorallia sp. API 0066 TaxID=2896846 RepID=UPI001E35D364|nr:condensation domain-containing protein [Actinocorallia sp. API 0066]MCD0449341.1 condensation domain-containing protein [Actinocorallia sp. API 0066]